MLYFSYSIQPLWLHKELLVHSTLKIWHQFRRHIKFNSLSIYVISFIEESSVSTILAWYNKGLTCLNDFYNDGVFHSRTDLSLSQILPTCFSAFRLDIVPKFYSQFFSPQQWEELMSPQKPIISKVYNEMSFSDSSPVTKGCLGTWIGSKFGDDWRDKRITQVESAFSFLSQSCSLKPDCHRSIPVSLTLWLITYSLLAELFQFHVKDIFSDH